MDLVLTTSTSPPRPLIYTNQKILSFSLREIEPSFCPLELGEAMLYTSLEIQIHPPPLKHWYSEGLTEVPGLGVKRPGLWAWLCFILHLQGVRQVPVQGFRLTSVCSFKRMWLRKYSVSTKRLAGGSKQGSEWKHLIMKPYICKLLSLLMV